MDALVRMLFSKTPTILNADDNPAAAPQPLPNEFYGDSVFSVHYKSLPQILDYRRRVFLIDCGSHSVLDTLEGVAGADDSRCVRGSGDASGALLGLRTLQLMGGGLSPGTCGDGRGRACRRAGTAF